MTRSKDPSSLPADARVLMIRLSALGDVIFALESLSSLKHERPDLRVDFLIEDRFASILEGHPLVHRLIVMPRKNLWRVPSYLRTLRSVRYDAVIDLHGLLKSSIHVLLTRSPRKIGYAKPGSREGAAFAYHERVQLPSPIPHRAEQGNHLLRALGMTGIRKAAELPTNNQLPEIFPDSSQPKVILHPGTSAFAAFKRWPIEKFITLGQGLRARHISIAMSYGPGESELFHTAKAAIPDLIEIDGTNLGLAGLGQAMQQADVVVAADTGPLHIAASVGTRVVALFGPKDSKLYGPRGKGHRILYHDVPCRPCKLRTCISPQCVLGIHVAKVESAVTELIES